MSEMRNIISLMKEQAEKNKKRLLQERFFVSTKALYRALNILGMEKWGISTCSYRWFTEKVRTYNIPFRIIEVPHPKNKKQAKYLIDITDEPELIKAVSLIKSKESSRKELRIKVPGDIYEILEQKAKEMNVNPDQVVEIILMKELSDRNKHKT